MSPMFRYERMQKGRYRQHMQLGAEVFGASSPRIDAEVIFMLTQFYQAIGIENFKVQINSLGCKVCRPGYREKLLAHFRHRISELCEDCKKHGDVLVVMVGNDISVGFNKGKSRPILNQNVRTKMVDSLKSVDYVFVDYPLDKNTNPLEMVRIVFEKLHPDVYVVNTDAFDIQYRKQIMQKYNVKLVVLGRWCPPEFENISTSRIIERILDINKRNT